MLTKHIEVQTMRPALCRRHAYGARGVADWGDALDRWPRTNHGGGRFAHLEKPVVTKVGAE
jgi:hypothetical protein